MIPREKILETLNRYSESDIKLATICSHSALQIFHGAKLEGFGTIGITLPRSKPYYESFPKAGPDEVLEVDNYREILGEDFQRRLVEENALIIPHGSFVEYVGAENLKEKFYVPMFGNRLTLDWEGDRKKQEIWLREAGVKTPRKFKSPEEIDRRVIVKLHGAKGGRGYFTASSPEEFYSKIDDLKKRNLIEEGAETVIEEFIAGVRYYPHFFLSLLEDANVPELDYGRLELLGIDRRLEVVDELYRGFPDAFEDYLDYTVTGNTPAIVREKFIVDLLEDAAKVVKASRKLFAPGLIGPFCLETVYHPSRGFTVFEVSARIVAGTNLYTQGSPYTPYYFDEPMSMGRRIAREIRNALKQGKLDQLIY
ncbi:MAG: formate--phosphoribosylaminoimidazolecarboxamide ligase [Thaumarchaeota archaeon]|nr:formate--phosphoribosylaminoimidazolecarboxamide ligase [Nitrososphaerota archaeon]